MPYITSIERMAIERGIQQGEVIMLKPLLIRRRIGLRCAVDDLTGADSYSFAEVRLQKLADKPLARSAFVKRMTGGPGYSRRCE